MRFFPVKSYELESLAKSSEIAAILSEHVQDHPLTFPFVKHKTFYGSVSDTGFRIVRVDRNRNSFRPPVLGTFNSSPKLTTIHVTIKHDVYSFMPVIIISALIIMFVCQFLAIPLLSAHSSNFQEMATYLSSFCLYFLIALGVFLFIGYLTALVFFESEATIAKIELAIIFAPIIFHPDDNP